MSPVPNKFEGMCTECGRVVAPGDGVTWKMGLDPKQKWLVKHTSCPKVAMKGNVAFPLRAPDLPVTSDPKPTCPRCGPTAEVDEVTQFGGPLTFRCRNCGVAIPALPARADASGFVTASLPGPSLEAAQRDVARKIAWHDLQQVAKGLRWSLSLEDGSPHNLSAVQGADPEGELHVWRGTSVTSLCDDVRKDMMCWLPASKRGQGVS